jgi:hypothetical protein
MCHLPDAYADLPRLQAVADTLGITVEAANQAFAQYVPRDAIEADNVEQIILARARLYAATERVLQADLLPVVAARFDRTITVMTRELRVLLDRLELRQNRFTGQLPQQYWRIDPITQVGPVQGDQVPDHVPDQAPAPEPVQESSAEPRPTVIPPLRWTDPPTGEGDALARFASMRLTADMPAQDAWMAATRDAAQQPLNRKLRRAQGQQRRAA